MTCHATPQTIDTGKPVKRVVLIGMPNTGKSTFFNRLTGASAFVGNWPGITVSFLQAEVKINQETIEFVDLPGIYDIKGFSEDEKVVQDFLSKFPVNLVVAVINASQIDRQIRLPLQLKALGYNTVVILNMVDEAEAYGIKICASELSERLQMPACLISAKYGRGCGKAQRLIAQALGKSSSAYQIEDFATALERQATIAPRQVEEILTGTVHIPSQLQVNLTARLDSWLLHPLLGLPLFLLGILSVFAIVWQVGLPAQDVMAIVTDWLQGNLLEPLASRLPSLAQSLLIEGIWNGVATVASFLPLVFLFFVLMAILEDSGYLARSAYLMDAFMAKLGLDGRSFVLQMMGFGCNVPALMGTRVMRSRALRWLTMLVIPFSLCSARLQVFVFVIAAVFPSSSGAIALFSLYLLSFAVAILTAFLFKDVFPNEEPFILELPPYRFPTFRQIFLRSWGEVREFLWRASGFITLGCIAVWAITHLPLGATGLDTVGGRIGQWLSPIMSPLGIDPYLTLALIFGLIAKEVIVGSLAVIYGLNAADVTGAMAESLTFAEAYSFCLFCLIYTPCLTTLVTIFNESKSWKFTVFSLVVSLSLAWLASFTFYQIASFWGYI